MKPIALFCALLMLFTGCTASPDISHHTPAVLHKNEETGYIPSAEQLLDLSITSPQAFVYDRNSKEFLYITGEEYILFPASTAKLLTILYAMTLLSPDEPITPGNELELVPENSSIAYIKAHHTLTAEMLIEGMLLPSGNDAAYVLAAAAGKRLDSSVPDGKAAVKVFMTGLNEYALSLGMCGSLFTTPDGFHDGSQYSTLEDMAIVARLAAENPLIMRYAGLASDDVVYASGHTNTWRNTNLQLFPKNEYYHEFVTGLKTGSGGTGNFSLITTVQFHEESFIIGIFSSPDETTRFRDTAVILKELCTDE